MEYLQYLNSSSTKLWPFRVSLRIFAEKANGSKPSCITSRPKKSMDHAVRKAYELLQQDREFSIKAQNFFGASEFVWRDGRKLTNPQDPCGCFQKKGYPKMDGLNNGKPC